MGLAHGRFFYPTHWSDDAPTAFTAVDGDHDSHGFSPSFVARMEDRDRYLEDFLGGGLGGFTFNFTGALAISVSDPLPSGTSTTISGLVFAFSVTSSTEVDVEVLLNGLVQDTVAIPANTAVFNAPLSVSVTQAPFTDVVQLRIVTPGTGGAGLVAVPY